MPEYKYEIIEEASYVARIQADSLQAAKRRLREWLDEVTPREIAGDPERYNADILWVHEVDS